MNTALWKKACRESYLLLIGCALVLYLFCWVRVWITSRLDMGRFQTILGSLPESWQRLAPVPIDQLFSYEGRIAVTYEEPVVYLMMAIWTIARSSDSVSGAIGRGTMEMLLAQPVSRKQVIATHTLVTLLGALSLSIIAYLGTWTGIATTSVSEISEPLKLPLLNISVPFTGGQVSEVPMDEKVTPTTFMPAAVNYFSLGIFLIGFTTLMSSWDRYRWRTIGITVGFYVVSTILELVGLAMEGFEWVKGFTFFSAYEPVRFVSEAVVDSTRQWAFFISGPTGEIEALGPLGYSTVLALIGLLTALAGAIVFCRRDLPAPL